jgi:hypothetical protein
MAFGCLYTDLEKERGLVESGWYDEKCGGGGGYNVTIFNIECM